MKLEKLEKEKEDLLKKLSNPEFLSNKKNFEEIPRKLKRIEEEINFLKTLAKIEKKIKEAEEILAEATDDELLSLAEEDLEKNKALREKILTEEEKKLKGNNNISEIKGIIVEIRAGTGGNEAALFAHDLFRMYNRYAENKGWPMKIINMNKTALDGLKEAVMEINNKEAFENLKYEAGVHRVQRVPETESSGRIHTSTVTVAVLPEAEEVDIEVKPEDLRVDVFRSSGPGGQSVNTTDSAVRITHVPTGIVVSCQDEKSQLKNKAKALSILRSRLLFFEEEKRNKEIGKNRKAQIGTGERSEKIRTYNFPQDRITEHRIGLSLHHIENIFSGDLDKIINPLLKEDQKRKLNELS